MISSSAIARALSSLSRTGFVGCACSFSYLIRGKGTLIVPFAEGRTAIGTEDAGLETFTGFTTPGVGAPIGLDVGLGATGMEVGAGAVGVVFGKTILCGWPNMNSCPS